jgi:hypothetical protein
LGLSFTLLETEEHGSTHGFPSATFDLGFTRFGVMFLLIPLPHSATSRVH